MCDEAQNGDGRLDSIGLVEPVVVVGSCEVEKVVAHKLLNPRT